MLDESVKIPNHVAIILDGNGRWAKSKGMPRSYGHQAGSKNLEVICEKAYRMGIQYLTVYAFSTENWSRPADEVAALMKLFRAYMKTCIKTAEKNHMCVKVIGDVSGFDQDLQEGVRNLEEATKDNDGLHFQVALNYGSRDEITRAFNRILQERSASGNLTEPVTMEEISSHLDTAGIPDPDLLIRTSGEQRLSNFLCWQLAYTEFYFCDCHWPDFDEQELEKAVLAYNRRDRRYGGV